MGNVVFTIIMFKLKCFYANIIRKCEAYMKTPKKVVYYFKRGRCYLMRVIGGSEKSKKISCPSAKQVRPTSDRVREALFNILGLQVKGITFIDGFAGSGSVGIEALSRGAGYVYFIDNHRRCIQAIRQNIARLEVHNRARIINNDILKGLEKIANKGVKADLIFLDPPYGTKQSLLACEHILEINLINKAGIVVLESYRKDEMSIAGWCQFDQRCYGDTKLTFLKKDLPLNVSGGQ